MDEDKKENFKTEIVKRGLAFTAIQYAVLKFTYHRFFANVQLKLWNCILMKALKE